MIKKYKTKPCEIEAIQFTRDNMQEIIAFTKGDAYNFYLSLEENLSYCYIKTLEGIMEATEGDFIIRGLRGEFYPCKPDVFARKYEEI